jgi:hypothetical protein
MKMERMRKEAVVPNLKYYPGLCLEGLRKTSKNIGQDSRSPGQDLNSGPPEYETGVLATRPRSSVTISTLQFIPYVAIKWLAFQLDDDHVGVVRLCLWTSATSGLTVHLSSDTWDWITTVEWTRQRKTLDSSIRAFWQSYQQSHPVAGRRNGRIKLWIWPCEVFLFIHAYYFFASHKILHGTDGFTSRPKEGVLRIFITLQNPSPRSGLNSRTLGPIASTLTITPPRRLSPYITYVVGFYSVLSMVYSN